jgi:hypothetical protein
MSFIIAIMSVPFFMATGIYNPKVVHKGYCVAEPGGFHALFRPPDAKPSPSVPQEGVGPTGSAEKFNPALVLKAESGGAGRQWVVRRSAFQRLSTRCSAPGPPSLSGPSQSSIHQTLIA